MRRLISALGCFVNKAAETSGYGLALLLHTTAASPHLLAPRRIRDVLNLLFSFSMTSLPVVTVVSVFVGMILALNFLISVEGLGIQDTVGRVVAVSMMREMGPFMTAAATRSESNPDRAENGRQMLSQPK